MLYGCEARKIIKITHHYIENTVESIQAAFDHGATIVEIDIRPTKDNRSECLFSGGLWLKGFRWFYGLFFKWVSISASGYL